MASVNQSGTAINRKPITPIAPVEIPSPVENRLILPPAVLIVLAAIFIGQNRDRQQVHLLWLTVESPMWLLLAALFVIGVVTGLLLRRRRR